MFRTLYRQLAAVLLALFLVVGGILLVLFLFTTRLHLQESTQSLNRPLAEHLASEDILLEDGQVNRETLEEIFHMLMVVNPSIELYLVNERGEILAFSAPPGKVKRKSIDLGPVQTFIAAGDALPILGDDPRDPGRKKIFSAAPIMIDEVVKGYLYVILGGEEYESFVGMFRGSYILRLSLWVAGGGLLIALLAGLLFFKHLTQRLRLLADGVEEFRESGFETRIETILPGGRGSGDEIGTLGEVFGQMADRIQEQIGELKRSDTYRRELYTNISHDLRTPLALLLGYLESLSMKGEKAGPEEQRKHLETALKHARRLDKLVTDLMELAKLDDPGFRPDLEPFFLPELLQDISQKFRLPAEEKGVAVEIEGLTGGAPVYGDIGLIERVFDNLIDNALRATDPGDRIAVSFESGEGRLGVRVTDTGRGIDPEDLPRIFDRFYQPQGGGKEPGGAGLGLAIARKILELHGSPLEVESSPGAGTAFSFHLAASPPSDS